MVARSVDTKAASVVALTVDSKAARKVVQLACYAAELWVGEKAVVTDDE